MVVGEWWPSSSSGWAEREAKKEDARGRRPRMIIRVRFCIFIINCD